MATYNTSYLTSLIFGPDNNIFHFQCYHFPTILEHVTHNTLIHVTIRRIATTRDINHKSYCLLDVRFSDDRTSKARAAKKTIQIVFLDTRTQKPSLKCCTSKRLKLNHRSRADTPHNNHIDHVFQTSMNTESGTEA